MDRPDHELIAEALQGSASALERLVARYLTLVYRVVLSYVKQTEEAEDLTQEVFVKVMRVLPRFDLTRPFKPWLVQIAKHQALDLLKKKKAIVFSQLETEDQAEAWEDTIPDPGPWSDAIVSDREAAAALATAVRDLPPQDQRLLSLHYIHGWALREIAEEWREAVNTIKSRHRRLLLRLRKRLIE